MAEYSDMPVSEVLFSDKRAMARVEELLSVVGLARDAHLDYTCAIFDSEGQAAATGSCFQNTLRCLAVSPQYQGEGLLNKVLTHLVQRQLACGYTRLFLYTKPDSVKFFESLGFYEIAEAKGVAAFMENRKNGFCDYLSRLVLESPSLPREKRTGAIVMNANPFTLGHRYLIERACADCGLLHLFVVSEDWGPIPFSVRRRLLMEGTHDLPNIVYHDSGAYQISMATFPGYFLREPEAALRAQASLDAAIFLRIAERLGITCRFVGSEPFSRATAIYNQELLQALKAGDVDCAVIPRLELGGEAVSASAVRRYLQEGRLESIRPLVPESTWAYFNSGEAQSVLESIRRETDSTHH